MLVRCFLDMLLLSSGRKRQRQVRSHAYLANRNTSDLQPRDSQLQISGWTSISECDNMNTVTLGIASHDAIAQSFAAAMRGEAQGHFISFDSPELLFQTLTETRWNLLRVMLGAGPLSIPSVARRLDRDLKEVHEDVTALHNCGVLERYESGSIVFPYDAIHVDFTLRAMAA